jgi:membrane associated rhomboid family serine protease
VDGGTSSLITIFIFFCAAETNSPSYIEPCYSLFDHWAHLGGAAFGVLYYYYGPAFWDFMRSLDAEMVDTTEDNGTTGGELETWSGPEEKPRV